MQIKHLVLLLLQQMAIGDVYGPYVPFFLAWFPIADHSKVVVLEGEV